MVAKVLSAYGMSEYDDRVQPDYKRTSWTNKSVTYTVLNLIER